MADKDNDDVISINLDDIKGKGSNGLSVGEYYYA